MIFTAEIISSLGAADYIALAVLALAVFAAVRYSKLRKKKSGCGGCGSCSGCEFYGNCSKNVSGNSPEQNLNSSKTQKENE